MPGLASAPRRAGRAEARAAGVLNSVMTSVMKELSAHWGKGEQYRQSSHRGDVREAAVQTLLTRLPRRYRAVRAEVVDAFGSRSRQIDVAVFDQMTCAPLVDDGQFAVLPAEALLCAIEVKPILTRSEVLKALRVASSLAPLRPFGRLFARSRTRGADANAHRFFFTIFAYTTDLAVDRWPRNEWQRLGKTSTALGATGDIVDRVVVLERGYLSPPSAKYKEFPQAEAAKTLHDWTVHVGKFLDREVRRRPSVDLLRYTPDERRGWKPLSNWQ